MMWTNRNSRRSITKTLIVILCPFLLYYVLACSLLTCLLMNVIDVCMYCIIMEVTMRL